MAALFREVNNIYYKALKKSVLCIDKIKMGLLNLHCPIVINYPLVNVIDA
jgi:hypothetical protein